MQLATLFADRSLADHALAFLAIVVMPALSVVSGRKIGKAGEASLRARYLLTLLRGMAIAVAVVFVWSRSGRSFSQLGLDWPPHSWGLYALFASCALIPLIVLQLLFLPRLVRNKLPEVIKQIDELKILPRTGNELMLFLLVAISAGIWEELMYRGFLVWYLLPLGGTVAAVVLSSLIFGAGHLYQGWKGLPRTAAIGLAFATGYVLTGSLWWAMLAHALVDIYGGLAGWRVRRLQSALAGT